MEDTVRALGIDTIPHPALLRWRVAAEGRAEQVAIEQSSGSPRFDAAAVWAMGLQEFAPARLYGVR